MTSSSVRGMMTMKFANTFTLSDRQTFVRAAFKRQRPRHQRIPSPSRPTSQHRRARASLTEGASPTHVPDRWPQDMKHPQLPPTVMASTRASSHTLRASSIDTAVGCSCCHSHRRGRSWTSNGLYEHSLLALFSDDQGGILDELMMRISPAPDDLKLTAAAGTQPSQSQGPSRRAR
jgi:hypothetical protein